MVRVGISIIRSISWGQLRAWHCGSGRPVSIFVANGFFSKTLSPGLYELGMAEVYFIPLKKETLCDKKTSLLLLKLIRLSCWGTVNEKRHSFWQDCSRRT